MKSRFTMPARKVVIIDNQKALHDVLRRLLAAHGYESISAHDGPTAIDIVRDLGCKIVICDLRMPGMDGKETIAQLRQIDPEIITIVHTAYEGDLSHEDFIALNIFDLIVKPPSIPRLVSSIRRGFQLLEAGEQVASLRNSLEIVTAWAFSQSQAVRDLVHDLHGIAWAGTHVVIHGESGTGKTVLARALHHLSRRARGPFVGIDMGTIADTVAESELFGHKRGSFTGANSDKKGLLSAAHTGTLFLDEIQNMSSHVQMKILNAVEHRSIRPIGGSTETEPADFRLISATNNDLRALVSAKKFREDLFYRIQESAIYVPALRDRVEDIPAMAQKMIQQAADAMEIPSPEIAPESLQVLQEYSWPGNIRELKSVMRHALAVCNGDIILPVHLSIIGGQGSAGFAGSSDRPRTLEEIERDAIKKALLRSGGNKTKAAHELSIDYKTLLNKIKRYQLLI